MRKETDLGGVKAIAKALLMTAVNQTPYSPMLVQHPFTSTGLIPFPTEMNKGFQPVDITLNEDNLKIWQDSVISHLRLKWNQNFRWEDFIMGKQTFALFFGNRGFMPAELIEGAREDMVKAVTDAGYDYIMMDKDATRYGAVETRDEGRAYAKWLKSHEGEYDGVILCMPIFIDENGAVAALQDAGVPILMQAYPDEIGKMDFKHRRDAFCGKFSVTDVFEQCRIPYTVMKPHVVDPLTPEFRQNLDDFAAVCRVVKGMRRFTIGSIGARTTAFKTVRFDEVAMQRHGINVESFDLSELFEFVRAKQDNDEKVIAKRESLEKYTDFTNVPEDKKLMLSKISVVIDEYIETYHLDAIALRCWNEMETYLRVCPCVLLNIRDGDFINIIHKVSAPISDNS